MPERFNTVLIVEDDPAIAEVSRSYLARGGYAGHPVSSVKAAIEALTHTPYGLVLLDLSLPDGHGSQVLDYLQTHSRLHETAVIVVTADATMSSAVDIMRRGAYDYLVKPFDADRLLTTLSNAKHALSLQSMVTTMREEINRERFHDFIGGSVPMQLVYQIVEAASRSRAPVFITGDSGTGKEIAARAIHAHGSRASGPFVVLNCAAIPVESMESELFGHVAGAFPGAVQSRMGAVERALGGTLFLDEVCEMPMEAQAKLLRFLQGNVYRPMGSDEIKMTNCRIISATRRDPMAEIAQVRFREDLYYRLHVVPLAMPPLRDHREDILPIAMDALRRISVEEGKGFNQISRDVQRTFYSYDWPGNVQQLLNIIRQIVVLNTGTEITRAMLPPGIEARVDLSWHPTAMLTLLESEQAQQLSQQAANAEERVQPLWWVERQAIEEALAFYDGNVALAADALQLNPETIYRKRAEWAAAQDEAAG